MKVEMLTREQEQQVYHRHKAGDSAAREKLILSVLPFATKLAKKFSRVEGVEQFDLVQEAALSIIDVVDNYFDPSKGRLITCLKRRIIWDLSKLGSSLTGRKKKAESKDDQI